MARKRKAASTNSTNATQQDSNNQTSLVPYEIERLQMYVYQDKLNDMILFMAIENLLFLPMQHRT